MDGLALRRDTTQRVLWAKWNALGRPPMYGMWLGGQQPTYLVVDPEAAKVVYRGQLQHTRSGDLGMGWMLNAVMHDGVGIFSGTRWTRVRKTFVHAGFAEAGVSVWYAAVHREIVRVLPQLAGTVRPQHALKVVLLRVIMSVVYGTWSEEDFQEVYECAEIFDDIMRMVFYDSVSNTWLYSHIPGTRARRAVSEYRRRWAAFHDRRIDAMRAALTKEPAAAPACFLKCLVQNGWLVDAATADARAERDEDGITFHELLDTLAEIVLGPVDGSGASLAWPLLLLAAHPDDQAALRDQLRESRRPGTNDEEWLMEMASARGSLLDNVCTEAQRLHPIFLHTVPEILQQPLDVAGFTLPAGTAVMLDVFSHNHNPSVWPEPFRFKPARFAAPGASPHGFGLGPRTCMGRAYARAAMRMLTAAVVSSYQLEVDNAAALRDGTANWPLEPSPFIFLPASDMRATPLA